MRAELLESPDDWRDCRDEWYSLLASCRRGISGPDATMAPFWAEALVHSLLKGTPIRTLLVREGKSLIGLVPTYESQVSGRRSVGREINLLTDANGGRAALLIADDAMADRCLDLLDETIHRWDVLKLTLIEGHSSVDVIREWARRRSLALRVLSVKESPYIKLPEHFDQVMAGLPKKFRHTLRKGERDLRSAGRFEYRCITGFDECRDLLDNIYAIERRSWKEQAATSITSDPRQREFYDCLVPAAALDGYLNAHLIFLDGKPIAYTLGLNSGDGAFLYLKGSFDADYAGMSAGHVMDKLTFERVTRDGIRTIDFMGRCDPYKMRWTDRTYRRLSLAIYNRTLFGRVRQLRAALASWRARGAAERNEIASATESRSS